MPASARADVPDFPGVCVCVCVHTMSTAPDRMCVCVPLTILAAATDRIRITAIEPSTLHCVLVALATSGLPNNAVKSIVYHTVMATINAGHDNAQAPRHNDA